MIAAAPGRPTESTFRFQVSIDPADAEISETYVPKDGDPPGPAQAAFNGLTPGRAYNISVETVSEGQVRKEATHSAIFPRSLRRRITKLFLRQISQPTTAQYRTVPWRPYNVTFDEATIGPDSFEVRWAGPRQLTEFDRYQVRRRTSGGLDFGSRRS